MGREFSLEIVNLIADGGQDERPLILILVYLRWNAGSFPLLHVVLLVYAINLHICVHFSFFTLLGVKIQLDTIGKQASYLWALNKWTSDEDSSDRFGD